MTAILGLSAFYHDSAAALLVDGRIVAAAQEERFSRKKHDAGFPSAAVAYCLNEAGLELAQLDFVAFYEKPILKFDRLIETYLAFAPDGFKSFRSAIPVWVKEKLFQERELKRGLDGQFNRRIVYAMHHNSHAASAFFPSPFEEAAILTMDGVGEWATASYGAGRGNRIQITHEQKFPHSLGLLYSAFTYYCGFKVNSGEYKLMGLAPYGQPRYVERIVGKMMEVEDDGSIWMDMSYFNYCQGLTMTSEKFHGVFGGPPRRPESPITEREMDIAASIQKVTEDVMLKAARHVHAQTGLPNLCLAGGVALNCVANGRIQREGPFERIWVQPASGDAGGALGAALHVWHQLLDEPRRPKASDSMNGSLLGPAANASDLKSFLAAKDARYTEYPDDASLCDAVADLMAREQVVGWFQGRMEFGPRALGARSIIGDARSPSLQSTMNLKIKFRESFRPFAPVVLKERVSEYFEMPPEAESPYMMLVAPVREDRRARMNGEQPQGLDRVKMVRSEIPAVTHVDYSARVQTVDPGRNGRFYELVKTFERKTGCPVIINTSFNVRGEPIVCTPEQAYRCFMATNMDVLVVDRFVLLKSDQPTSRSFDPDEYATAFQAD
ncbi:MAG TPA: carbamoyltransferase [Vicinamibacterales bacterium]